MAYLDLWAIRGSGALKARFTVAVEKAAYDVINEPGTVTNHAQRLAWAKRVITSATAAEDYGQRFMRLAVIGNATLQSAGEAATDNDIQFVTNSLIDSFALAEA